MYGICNLSLVPCRKSPSDRAEMVTQLLFGECFEVLEENEKWVKIKNGHDQYISWIDKKQFQPISFKTFSAFSKETRFSLDLVHPISAGKENAFPVILGSSLPGLAGTELEIGETSYSYDGQTVKPTNTRNSRASIAEYAYFYLNAPYLWGGRSPFGIDCSGFTQMVFRLTGVPLQRDAWQQALAGETINFVEEAQAGDLAFFDNAAGKITHVGILLGNNKIIHASGKVRVDNFDHYGIYNEEKKLYSHQLRIIKSVL